MIPFFFDVKSHFAQPPSAIPESGELLKSIAQAWNYILEEWKTKPQPFWMRMKALTW